MHGDCSPTAAFTLADRTPTYYLVMVRHNGMTITAQQQAFAHAVLTAAGYLADLRDAAAQHGGPYAAPSRTFARVFISNGQELREYSATELEALNQAHIAGAIA